MGNLGWGPGEIEEEGEKAEASTGRIFTLPLGCHAVSLRSLRVLFSF